MGLSLVRALGQALERLVPPDASGLLVGLSGGADSCCLAVALTELPARLPVRAIHVDHGLQGGAPAFRAASIALCGRLGLPVVVVAPHIVLRAGESVEEAARDARYDAIAAQLAPGECLLTAHHRDDQAETFLIQALRGSGPKGLAAMPPSRRLGAGWHLRPLLDVPRADLRRFAAQRNIQAIEDPMNGDPRFDRAFLRSALWPTLVRRWPGAAAGLARAAEHSAEAQQILDGVAELDLAGVRDGDSLALPRLRCLARARQVNALRHWIAAAGAPLPPTARLTEALRQVLDARADHQPLVRWGACALRRYRDRIFLTPARAPALPEALRWHWQDQPVIELGPGLGRLRAVVRPDGVPLGAADEPLTIRRRRGGEQLRIAVSGRRQSVQHLCQRRGVLPWLRDALPFIHAGAELIAVGDLWRCAGRRAAADATPVAFAWEEGPELC